MLKVEKGQDPYYVIERYIYEHTEVLEDMIAVLEIDGVRTNELLEVDAYYDGFGWLNDWWEGEPEIALIDFFPVSEAISPKTSIPVEWINQRVKGLEIQLINADEDDVDLIWHLRDEIQTLTELIDYWKAEQEKQK